MIKNIQQRFSDILCFCLQPAGPIRVRIPQSPAPVRAVAMQPAGPVRSPQSSTSSVSTKSGELYRCEECGHTTASHVGMYYHQNKHKGIYPYHCPYCNKGHSGTNHLRGHLKSTHNIIEPLQCMFCGMTVEKIAEYVKHVRDCSHRPVVGAS